MTKSDVAMVRYDFKNLQYVAGRSFFWVDYLLTINHSLAGLKMCSICLSEYFSPFTRWASLMAQLGVALTFEQL
jgi:hypothetical protein